MRIFIDTNIFLSFYHFTNEDLEELKKLILLIVRNKVILFLPEQMIDETWRNRAAKIKEQFDPLKKESFSLVFPAYCRGYSEYELIKKARKECEKHHAEMIKKIEKDITEHKLEADIIIKELFEKAFVIKRTTDIISKARERMDIGNPPGKNNSLGDAINWESLLSSVPKKIEFCIIADDKDLYSPLDTDKLNDFLQNEWQSKKDCKPRFYRKLSIFFKDNFPDINLKAEIEKDTLIGQLSASPNFASTHLYIGALSKYNDFSSKQAEDLINALLVNSQIRSIITDEDVYNFYRKIYDYHFFSFIENEELDKLLSKTPDKSDDMDIPF